MSNAKPIFIIIAVVGLSLLLTSCRGAREAREPGIETEPETGEMESVDMANIETFDPAPYTEEDVPQEIQIEHDVPETLMEGRASTGVVRTAQGFRIQVLNTLSKQEADAQVENLISWWRGQRQTGTGGDLFRQNQAPVYTIYRQPYYRVRVGDFATREQAQQALNMLKQDFPAALIVPDTVTLTQ